MPAMNDNATATVAKHPGYATTGRIEALGPIVMGEGRVPAWSVVRLGEVRVAGQTAQHLPFAAVAEVVSGEGTLEIPGEPSIEFAQHDVFTIVAGVPHCWHGNEDARIALSVVLPPAAVQVDLIEGPR